MKIIVLNAILLLLEKLFLLKLVCVNKDIMIMAVTKNAKNAINLVTALLNLKSFKCYGDN